MLRTTIYCALCCTDLRRDPKASISYRYDYTLVGLLETLCRHLNSSIESIFGKANLDLAREKLAVCVKCKKILVKILGLEAEIESIKKEIGSCVQNLTARCLSCGVRNCSVCQGNRVFKTSAGLIGCEDQVRSHDDQNQTLGLDDNKERLKKRLESKYLPEVLLQVVNPEESANLHGLTIHKPKPVAPNEFIDLIDVLDTESEAFEGSYQPSASEEVDPVLRGSDSVHTTVDTRELPTSMNISDGIDELSQEEDAIRNVTFNFNPGIFDAQRLTLNGEPLFTATELGYKCLKCQEETVVPIEELNVHCLAHGGVEINFILPAAPQEVPASVALDETPASLPSDPYTVQQPQEVTAFDRRRKDHTLEVILNRELPEEFLKRYKLLNVACPGEAEGMREMVSVYTLGDDLYLLENQWKFEFQEGGGYRCLTCSAIHLTPADLVAHCRAEHKQSLSSHNIVGTRMITDFAKFRRRIRNHISAKEDWRATFHVVCSRSQKFLKPFDYLTKSFEGSHFVYDNKLKFHVNKDFFICDSCEFKEQWKSAFVDHLFEVHADEQTTGVVVRAEASMMEQISPGYFSYRGYTCHKVDNKFCCDTCAFQGTDIAAIRRHLYMGHYNKNRFICGICHTRFLSKPKLVEHTKQHSDPDSKVARRKARESGLEKLTEIAPNKLTYRGFEVTRIGDEYSCDTCSTYKTSSRMNLYHHLYQTHYRKGKKTKKKRDHICETCGKVFTNRNTFYAHTKKHEADANLGHFTCEVCGVTKTNSVTFYNHTRRHREKKITCPECGKKYFTKTHLDVHLLTHSEERNHVCLQCNKAYKSRESLQLHCKSHNGVKPYSCDICFKTFTQSYSVTKHKRSMHADVLDAASKDVR